MIRLESSEAVRRWRGRGGTVSVVAGTFDILHPGNVAALGAARAAGDRVVVGITPDTMACGPGRPQHTEAVRAELAVHLRAADAVMVPGPDAGPWLEAVQPFRWVTHAAAPPDDLLATAVARACCATIAVSAVPGCSAAGLREAMNAHRTPVAVPPELYPAPASDVVSPALLAGPHPLVTANGCFDILHIGHVRFLGTARGMGQRMIVLVNDDASVARYKGPTRPVFPVGFRVAALAALRSVDAVVPFSGDDPLGLIGRIRPDIHVKGGSYEPERVRSERELVEAWGGRLVCTELVEGYSTTEYIRRTLAQCPP